MFSLVGGSARRQERAATNQFVKMNGVRTYVTRKTISVPTVQIDVLLHLHIWMSIVIWKVKMRTAAM